MQNDYWHDREEAWLKECQEEEKDLSASIDQIYAELIQEIEEQISLFYAKFAEENGMTMAEAQEYLGATDIAYYIRLAKKYVRMAAIDIANGNRNNASVYFSEEADKQMSRYNTTMKISRLKMLLEQLLLREKAAQSKVQNVLEEALTQRAEDEITRQAGILGETVPDNVKERAKIIAEASFHGATFSERIWGPNQEALQKALQKCLENGLISGESPKKLAAELRKVVAVSQYHAERLLRTELARVQTEAQKQSYEEFGYEDYTFLTSTFCCKACKELDGKHFKTKEMESGKNAPPLHPNCRCSTAAYMDDDSYEAWLDAHAASSDEDEEVFTDDDSFKAWQNLAQVPEEFKDTVEKMSYDDLFKAEKGDFSVEDGVNKNDYKEEMKIGMWISRKLGGKIIAQQTRDKEQVKWPDFIWNDAYWELKTPLNNSKNTISSNVRRAINQLTSASKVKRLSGKGGVILDISKSPVSLDFAITEGLARINRSKKETTGLIIVRDQEVLAAYWVK